MFKKNRKLRRLTREHISKNIAKPSKIHDYTQAHVLRDVNAFRERTCIHGNPIKAVKEGSIILRFERPTMLLKVQEKEIQKRVTGISRPSVFSSQSKNKLLRVLPPVVNPSKKIVAPYSQGNIEIFGHNFGQQWDI